MNLSAESRQQAMFCHLLSFCGWLIPSGNLIGPLILWVSKKDRDPFVDDQGKEVLNFQITVTLAALASVPLVFIGIGVISLVIIGIGSFILTIIAALQAQQGVCYRYPWTIRLIK